jgi:dTDP-4-amino-4,6-dideoxygalactose transaminase
MSTERFVPFNRPSLTGRELEFMTDAVRRGHISGDGHYTAVCREALGQLTGAHDVLLTTSCTHALEMCALLLDLRPGDEVILPSFTFVSTVNAFVLRGARPVFVDIRPDTLNIDERLIESAVTPRTRAIVVVHYAGVGCEMDVVMSIAERHGLAVVEDAAHALGATYRGRLLGSIAPLGTLSFHETKNIQCGEGGALLLRDDQYLARAEILREKGTNRSQFFRGQVDKYTWVDVGSSFLPSDLLAAFLAAQLEHFDEIQRSRMRAWQRYELELAEWAGEMKVGLPHIPSHCSHPAHLFYLIMPSLEQRQAFIEHLGAAGVKAVFHYVPLHGSPMGRQLTGQRDVRCPVTEDLSERLVRLPLFASLTDDEQSRVIDAVLTYRAA